MLLLCFLSESQTQIQNCCDVQRLQRGAKRFEDTVPTNCQILPRQRNQNVAQGIDEKTREHERSRSFSRNYSYRSFALCLSLARFLSLAFSLSLSLSSLLSFPFSHETLTKSWQNSGKLANHLQKSGHILAKSWQDPGKMLARF